MCMWAVFYGHGHMRTMTVRCHYLFFIATISDDVEEWRGLQFTYIICY